MNEAAFKAELRALLNRPINNGECGGRHLISLLSQTLHELGEHYEQEGHFMNGDTFIGASMALDKVSRKAT